MKKFLLIVTAGALLLALFSACFCYVIDPFNVMHPLNIRDNGVEPNKNYIKITYILANPEKFDAFLF